MARLVRAIQEIPRYRGQAVVSRHFGGFVKMNVYCPKERTLGPTHQQHHEALCVTKPPLVVCIEIVCYWIE